MLNCQVCGAFLTTNCSLCMAGYSLSNDGMLCYSCPLNCADCNSSACLACNSGYTLNNITSTCDCDSSCMNCLSLTSNSCSNCTSASDCSGCAAGYYLSGNTCLQCLHYCEACGDNSTCSSCNAPFILDVNNLCVCNNTNGEYLTGNSSDCQLCGLVIADCVACSSHSNGTFCNSCVAGKYYNISSGIC